MPNYRRAQAPNQTRTPQSSSARGVILAGNKKFQWAPTLFSLPPGARRRGQQEKRTNRGRPLNQSEGRPLSFWDHGKQAWGESLSKKKDGTASKASQRGKAPGKTGAFCRGGVGIALPPGGWNPRRRGGNHGCVQGPGREWSIHSESWRTVFGEAGQGGGSDGPTARLGRDGLASPRDGRQPVVRAHWLSSPVFLVFFTPSTVRAGGNSQASYWAEALGGPKATLFRGNFSLIGARRGPTWSKMCTGGQKRQSMARKDFQAGRRLGTASDQSGRCRINADHGALLRQVACTGTDLRVGRNPTTTDLFPAPTIRAADVPKKGDVSIPPRWVTGGGDGDSRNKFFFQRLGTIHLHRSGQPRALAESGDKAGK